MSSLVPDSLFDAILPADQFHRLGWVVVHSLWQAAAVAAVLAIALRLLPRQSAVAVQFRYLVATLALLSLPAACAVTYAIVSPSAAVPAAESFQADRAISLAADVAAAGDQAALNDRGAASAQSAKAQNFAARIGMISRPAVVRLAPWLPFFAAAWLAGAVVAAVRLGIGWSLTRRLVATATPPADARWQARLDRWAGALGVTGGVRFLTSARVDAPLVFGWFRPAVVWPLAALTGMPPDQIDAILAHELAHVRRHDVLVNLVQSCIEALFFHHPAAWWISAQVRAEREHCADDLAVRALAAAQAGSRLSYAAALLSLDERRQTLLAVAADGGSLGDRVRRLAGVEPAAGHPARLAAAVLVVAAVVVTAASVATTARRVEAAPPAARPDGLPADTNQITSLTAEQAKSLVASFKGVSVEIPEKKDLPFWVTLKLRGALPLNRLTTLDAETARALLEYDKGLLLLDGLTSLDADTARALAGARTWSGSLPALKSLSADVAGALAEFKGYQLSFAGLTTLDAETAAALAAFKGSSLSFDGLTKLDAKTARALAGFTTHPPKDGDGSAQKFRGVWLRFNGLETLDAETATALTSFKGEHTSIYLTGLKSLSVDAARALGEHKGDELHLGLPQLSADVAAAVKDFKCVRLFLEELTGIDAATAATLAAYGGRGLVLGGLEKLSVDAARALAGFKGGALGLCGPKLPSPDVLDAIAAFRGGWLWLSGPTTLSEPQARSLARFKGQLLAIDSLPTLTADAARALAEFQGKDLMLDSLTAVDADTAQALAAFKGDVRLESLKSLSLDTARFLYERRPQKELGMYFFGITALDTPDAEQVARYLARCEGKLFLPALEKISPKALNALLAKQDIVLPPIDLLELIPEPDGSPTVKVAIPEGFEERQKQLMQP